MRLTDHRLEQLLKVAQEMHEENVHGPSAKDLLLALRELQDLREERRRQLAALIQNGA